MIPKLAPSSARKLAVALFLGGFAVRLLTLSWPGMADVKAWKAWSTAAAEIGVARVYGPSDAEMLRLARERAGPLALLTMPFPRTLHAYHGEEYYVDYPPASMLLLTSVGNAYAVLDPGGANGWLFNALLNLLPLSGSLLIACGLWRSAPPPLGAWRAIAFWCNPAVLLAAALGYQDAVMGAAALACILALSRRRLVLASVFLALAGLLKPQAILLLPTFLVMLLGESRPRTWLRALGAAVVVGVVVFLPWLWSGYALSALEGALRPGGEVTVSSHALNLWWAVGYFAQWMHEQPFPLARILFLDEFFRMAGWDARLPARLLLVAGSLVCVALLLRHRREDPARVPLSVIAQTFVFFLFSTGVHENHAYLVLVLIPLLMGVWEKAGRVYWLSSCLMFANLFLLEGFGRGVLRDRVLVRLRLAAALDLTVIVALLQVAVLGLILVWWARRTPGHSS